MTITNELLSDLVDQPLTSPYRDAGQTAVCDMPDLAKSRLKSRFTAADPVQKKETVELTNRILNANRAATIPPSLILSMRERYSHRVATVKAQIRINNQCRNLVSRAMGWQVNLPQNHRKKINAAAIKLIKLLKNKKPIPMEWANVAEAVSPFCFATDAAREHFDTYREKLEKQLKADAECLPVWEWCDPIKGFSSNFLSWIVGEAGNLSDYSNPRKLWKRLGLAPKDSYRMLTKEGKEAFAVPRHRRAVIWNIGEQFIKQRTPKYRAMYDQRKAYETARAPTMSKQHAHRRAQRWMEKQFLKDLWNVWHFGHQHGL